MKETEDKQLHNLFRNMELTETSTDFEKRLMERIALADCQRAKKRHAWSVAALVCGTLAVLATPFIVLSALNVPIVTDIPKFSFDFNLGFSDLRFPLPMVGVTAVVLILLVGDTLVRKQLWNRKHRD